jgi:hypothetical protein
VDIGTLQPGMKLLLEDGSTVEVLAASTDGRSVRVRYLDSPFAPQQVGTEGWCTDYEITGFTDDEQTDTAVQLS